MYAVLQCRCFCEEPMGHHYVPQRYLRKFEDKESSGYVWQYLKKGDEPRRVRIKSAAQSRDFYESDVETLLAEQVELPGGDAIDKILEGGSLNESERFSLALYLAVMLKRVPAYRSWAEDGFFEKLPAQMERFREDARTGKIPSMRINVQKAIELIDVLEKKFENEIPSTILNTIRNPFPSERILSAFYTMYWRVFIADGPQEFVTSDNPLFYTRGSGIGNLKSEMHIPLSPTHLLQGSRISPVNGIPRFSMPDKVVRVVNKWTAFYAKNLVYSHKQVGWLPPLLSVQELNLFVPQWTPKPIR